MINNSDSSSELSKNDEIRFRDALDKYYKGELEFMSFEDSKAKTEEFLRKLGANA